MAKNTLTSWPTGWNWEKKNKFSPMNENISSILQDKRNIEDSKTINNFEKQISWYIRSCVIYDSYEMRIITKDKLVEMIKEKFIKNFKKMSLHTANEKIETAVNKFLIARDGYWKTNDWRDYFVKEIMEKRKYIRELTETELEWIIDDEYEAKKIMRNLDKYVLNLDLAKALAKAWVFHEYELFPNVHYEGVQDDCVWIVDYSNFWITKDDIDYLCEMSFKIQEGKNLKSSVVLDLEDEIDEYF